MGAAFVELWCIRRHLGSADQDVGFAYRFSFNLDGLQGAVFMDAARGVLQVTILVRPGVYGRVSGFARTTFIRLKAHGIFQGGVFRALVLLLGYPRHVISSHSGFEEIYVSNGDFPANFHESVRGQVVAALLVFVARVLVLIFLGTLSFNGGLLVFDFRFIQSMFRRGGSRCGKFVFQYVGVSTRLVHHLPCFLFGTSINYVRHYRYVRCFEWECGVFPFFHFPTGRWALGAVSTELA